MSQAAALPANVLIPSMDCRKRSAVISWRPVYRTCGQVKIGDIRQQQSIIREKVPDDAGYVRLMASGLLLRVRAEVMVVGHAAIHDRVLLPLRGALGEGLLGLGDFLEQGILGRFLGDDLV